MFRNIRLPYRLEDTGWDHLKRPHALVAVFMVLSAFLSISQIGWISCQLQPSTKIIGILGWLGLFYGVIYSSKHNIRSSACIFFIFFGLGFWIGSFLEPPSDPTHHLFRTYHYYIDSDAYSIQRKVNFGFWHYSMNSIFLSLVNNTGDSDTILGILSLLNGVYWGLLGVCVYLVTKAAGLPGKWALLSCILCLCFFGTNKFSYFRYYSYGPTFTNMMMLMLWVKGFFFVDDLKRIVLGIACAILLLPVLYVNHIQEAAFLGIVVFIWLIIVVIHKYISRRVGIVWIFASVFLLLFVLPQVDAFHEFLKKMFHRTLWNGNPHLTYTIGSIFLIGKIWNHRVVETLGLMGFMPLLIAFPALLSKCGRRVIFENHRALVLGSMALIGYCTPLINFIWTSNVRPPEYYRLSYISFYWIFICLILWKIEFYFYGRMRFDTLSWIKRKFGIVGNNIFFVCSFLIVLSLGSVRATPIYGKINFLLVDSMPWYPAWKPMISDLLDRTENKPVLTDSVTGNVLYGLFNIPIANRYNSQLINYRRLIANPFLADHNDTPSIFMRYRIVVNLMGFEPTWVGPETRHWNPRIADTSKLYRFGGPVDKSHPLKFGKIYLPDNQVIDPIHDENYRFVLPPYQLFLP